MCMALAGGSAGLWAPGGRRLSAAVLALGLPGSACGRRLHAVVPLPLCQLAAAGDVPARVGHLLLRAVLLSPLQSGHGACGHLCSGNEGHGKARLSCH